MSFEIIKLGELIEKYVVERDDCARVEFLNQVYNGEELAEALFPLQSKIKEYEKDKNKTPNLINDLEKIIKNKEGTIINELKEIINIYK